MKIYELMSDEELIEEYTQLYEMINKFNCFGVKDCLRFEYVESEMEKRGIDIYEE